MTAEITDALSMIQSFIVLAKDIRSYITPEYSLAAKGLFKIIDNILAANQNLLRWIHDFEMIDLSTEKSQEFSEFQFRFSSFRMGPDYTRAQVHCTEISSIYNNMLDNPLKKLFFKNTEKMSETTKIFANLTNADGDLIALINEIFFPLENTINEISVCIVNGDWSNARNKQKIFIILIKAKIQELERQTDQLTKLRVDYLRLSGATVSE